jgi:hypothetical protein
LSSRIIRSTRLWLMVKASLPQFCRHSAVPVGRKFHRDLLQGIVEFHFYWKYRALQSRSVKARAAQAGHLTQRMHGLAFRRGLTDFFKRIPATDDGWRMMIPEMQVIMTVRRMLTARPLLGR